MYFIVGTNMLKNCPLRQAIEIIGEQGFAGAEIWAEHLWDSSSDLENIKATLDSLNMVRTLHAPTRDINITSTNPGIRDESLKQILGSLNTAAYLGATTVVVHPGRMSSSKDEPDKFLDLQVDVLKKICLRADQLGLKVGIENMEYRPKELVMAPAEINYLVRAINCSNCGITFDIAHAITWCYQQIGKRNLVIDEVCRFFEQLVNVIHVHISNTDLVHTHLPLDEGDFDLQPLLQIISSIYDGPLAVEGYRAGSEVEVLRKNARITKRFNLELK